MNTVAAGATKKRKKSDTKPQAQINKCNNEKRRREQENNYIEELAELISANFADMSSLSVKPDKCAILQETVNQIRNLKAREEAAVAAGAHTTADAVQQGEVSSSRPTILANEVIAPLVLEALDGFLLVVNADGKVEFVTENVSSYIKFSRDEVLGKSVYNFIHHGDHARFSSNLLPMSINLSSGGSSTSGDSVPNAGSSNTSTNTANNVNANASGTSSTGSRSRSFYCRLLVKPPDDQEETMEEKQTRVNQYEQMHISSTQVPYSHASGSSLSIGDSDDGSSDTGPCLLCLARRVPQCEKATGTPIEQFTTKLDITGKIVGIDTSGVSPAYSHYLNKDLMGRIIQEICPPHELPKLTNHLKETLTAGQATSEIYKFRVTSPDKYVRVQTKSKYFKHSSPESDFIMATHSIIGEHDSLDMDNVNVGGPLMSSVMNGARNGVPSTRLGTSTTNDTTMSTASFSSIGLNSGDMEFGVFPSSTWDVDWTETPKPDSCQSVTPVSTPRPSSAPEHSPAASALTSPFTAQPSPSAANAATSANNPFSGAFSFSPLTDTNFPIDETNKDVSENVLEESTGMAESGRLRNLLTKPSSSVSDSSNDTEMRNNHRILKGLLNQDDEENRSENRASPRGSIRTNIPGPSDQPKHANNMLLKLLNEKSDDELREQRAGIKPPNELLQQLLKEQNEDRKTQDDQTQGDTLLRSLGFSNTPSPPSSSELAVGKTRKRPSDEHDDVLVKRLSDSVQVSSSGPSVGNSKLCEKNKMLLSLLAKQPSSTTIPPIPASVISATPQDKLPRVTKNNFGIITTQNTPSTQSTNDARQNNRLRMTNRSAAANYLNQILTPGNDVTAIQTSHSVRQVAPNRNQFAQMDANTYTNNATATEQSWDIHTSPDPVLSDILDQVIEFVADEHTSAVMTLLDTMESPQNNNYEQAMNEKMAINAIQKSLMQCETAVKSPSSPTISLPGTPPAYSVSMTSPQTNQGNFPPPPIYARNSFPIRAAHQIRGISTQPYVVSGAGPSTNQQQTQIMLQQRKLIQHQQQQQQQQQTQQQQLEQKRRLLQQQQQQQLLIPSNAAAAEMSAGIQNIDNLLNNTVAPNVTLQRSSSVPDSQLSPGYGTSLINVNSATQSQRHNQQPYSPHSQMTSPLSQQGYPQTSVSSFQQSGARLSPHPPFPQQLSPRQGYPPAPVNNQTPSWTQAQTAGRLSLQQQQNPMLNAQLTGSYTTNPRGFAVQRQPVQQPSQQQRTVGSPGTVGTRQSPFSAEAFPPPASPTSGFASTNQFQQQLRLQRTMSAPSTTTQLPGGLGSPRPYAGRGDHPSGTLHHQYPSPAATPSGSNHLQTHSHSHAHAHSLTHGHAHTPHPSPAPPPHHQHQLPLMYQQDSQYCYDQTGLQLAFSGADRARVPTAHLQGGSTITGNGMSATSEYVRQELRAVVGARTGQAPPPNNRVSSQLHGQQVSPADLEALGLTFEMPTSGASDSPKLWGGMGSDIGSISPQPPPTLSSSSRTSTEELIRTGDQKSSLLQKLLSE